jgi:hypothetical protein
MAIFSELWTDRSSSSSSSSSSSPSSSSSLLALVDGISLSSIRYDEISQHVSSTHGSGSEELCDALSALSLHIP